MAPINHVIVLMLENNSFDRMLGALFPERVDGGSISGTAGNHWNDDNSSQPKPPIRHVLKSTITRVVQPDPLHELEHVLGQISGHCKGFVTDYASAYPTSTWQQRQEIMGYYDDGALPVLHTLAKE